MPSTASQIIQRAIGQTHPLAKYGAFLNLGRKYRAICLRCSFFYCPSAPESSRRQYVAIADVVTPSPRGGGCSSGPVVSKAKKNTDFHFPLFFLPSGGGGGGSLAARRRLFSPLGSRQRMKRASVVPKGGGGKGRRGFSLLCLSGLRASVCVCVCVRGGEGEGERRDSG